MSVVDFNLDALAVEESGEPFRFTWGGETFEIPLLQSMPLRKQMALLASGSPVEQINLLIGEEMLERLSSLPGADGQPMTLVRIAAVLEAYMAHQGTAPGKSRASSPSFASTARRSKRTSSRGR